MLYATTKVAEEMQGFKLAYTQSDESTFLLANLGDKEGGWFDYKVQKLSSVTASLFTEAFNAEYQKHCLTAGHREVPAIFDARAFSIPVEDAANNFVWRQQDWNRNSVQMLGHHYVGHNIMQGLNTEKVRNFLLKDHGIDWFKLDNWKKFGTFVIPHADTLLTSSICLNYDEINRVTELDQYLRTINDSYSK